MSVEVRGGEARTFRFTAANGNAIAATNTAVVHELPFQTKYLQITNIGATNVLRVYWTQEDFDDDDAGAATDGFLELAVTDGYFEGPVECETLYLRGVGGTTDVVVTAYQKLA